ncbi:ATP-grasp domain-containing protein [Candidatus Woesearchaeota archaeon]|nr:ATP-grasp domain-containing protein [Candidatus Woesearchaeota archaeon]
MRIAVLSNIFKASGKSEVEDDLTKVGNAVRDALLSFGHDVQFYDVNETTFEKLRKAKIDMAFNVCERFNGSSFFEPHVASMLELLQIPYTGSGPLTLAMCMNKARVKEILTHHEIPTPKFQVFYSKNKKMDDDLRFPLIVKPTCMDNSIGITNKSIVYNEKEMRARVAYVIRMYNQPALVEEYIEGRELAVGVLGNNGSAKVLPIFEHEFPNDMPDKILNYDTKWDDEGDSYNNIYEVCPAPMPKYLEAKIRKIALDVYKILDVKDYGRVDIRLSNDGIPYVLEMNPNPGISADCQIPIASEEVGLKYHEMIHGILKHAMERHGINPENKVEEPKKIVSETQIPGVIQVR